MISSIISRVVILVFGTLYPAYASYKAVRTKNLKEYVKWMMYWIVFALFTCAETFTDVFLSWFPFYYEIKIILVLWLLSPATKGSSILYRKFVHPALSRREQEIDDAIAKAKEQGYHTVLNLGSRGVNYATTVIMQTAIRGGGGLVQQLKKSYSLSDLTDSMPHSRSEQDMVDEADDVLTDPHLIRRSVARSGYNTRRSASESNNRTPLYFSEVDVDVRPTRASHPQDFSHIKSSDDISSGYSSADNSATREQGLSRTGSVGGSGKLRSRQITTRSTVTTIKRPGAAEGNEVIIEELHDNDSVDYENLPALLTLPPTCHISRTNPPFLFEYVGNEIRIIKILGDVSPNFVTVGDDLNIQQSSNSVTDSAYKPENDVPKMEVEENFKICENSDITKTEVFFETMSDADQLPKKVNINEGTTHVNKNSTNVPSLVENEELSNETDKVITKTEDIANTTITLSNDELKLKRESSVSFEKKVNDFLTAERKCSHSTSSSNVSLNSAKTDQADVGSIGTSSLNDDAAETDDEASYGTPEDSPKAKKKTARGKYGKSRAPAPPNIYESKVIQDNMITDARSSISEDENKPPSSITSNLLLDSGAMKEFGTVAIHSVKPTESDTYGHISKTNCKSKSPAGRKAGGSSITRFMQLPGKLAFWHKTDDKDKSEYSSSSAEHSRRSSTVEKADDFQSCVDLQETPKNDSANNEGPNQNIPKIQNKDDETAKHIPLTDTGDLEESEIAKDILDKSDALKKLIEAKLESHPEYKLVSLHGEEFPSSSKSTEV